MKRVVLAGILALLPLAAQAQESRVGFYCTLLSAGDKVNSRGAPLSTAAQIVRQDRANYHRFDRRDAQDQGDPWFGNPDMRVWLEQNLRISPITADIIRQWDSWTCVSIYGTSRGLSYATAEVPG